jgi:prevent-host-death family protein
LKFTIKRLGVIMIENHWQLQEAKNKFSNLVETAQRKGPQIVTKHGKEAVVVVTRNTREMENCGVELLNPWE